MKLIFEVNITEDHHRMKTSTAALRRLRQEASEALSGCESIEGNAVVCVDVKAGQAERGQ